jgi:hypothetical protein
VGELQDTSREALANQMALCRPGVKVLLLENRSRLSTPQNAATAGYFLLRHPFTPDVLVAKVRSALDVPASTPALE